MIGAQESDSGKGGVLTCANVVIGGKDDECLNYKFINTYTLLGILLQHLELDKEVQMCRPPESRLNRRKKKTPIRNGMHEKL